MRGLWFAAGTAAGIYASTKVRRAAEAVTVDGIHDRLTGWFAGARVLRDEVRAGMTEKETELHARLALVPHGVTEPDNVRHLGRRRHLELTRQDDIRPHEHPHHQGHDRIGKGDS